MVTFASSRKVGVGAWASLVVVVGCSGGHSSSRDPGGSASAASALTIPYPGAGKGGQSRLLIAGFTPNACLVDGALSTFDSGATQVTGPEHIACYYSSVAPSTPMAFLEQVVETAQGQGLVHVRLTMNPAFVDNTYGDTAIGWGSTAAAPAPGGPMPGGPGGAMPGGPMGAGGPMPMGPGGHTFKDLVESDHAEFDLTDGTGATALSFDLDYITASSGAPSGYGTLGVAGGDGKMLTGDPGAIVYASTSLDRDLNACGSGSYTTDSPSTDASYTPNAAAPNWDYRVVYDVWVKQSAFAGGFGNVTIPYVHASPSKLSATLPVNPGPCPPPFASCDGGNCGSDTCYGDECSTGTCEGEGCDDAGEVVTR